MSAQKWKLQFSDEQVQLMQAALQNLTLRLKNDRNTLTTPAYDLAARMITLRCDELAEYLFSTTEISAP